MTNTLKSNFGVFFACLGIEGRSGVMGLNMECWETAAAVWVNPQFRCSHLEFTFKHDSFEKKEG